SLFSFHATTTPATYTLSLHDALPICRQLWRPQVSKTRVSSGDSPSPCSRLKRFLIWSATTSCWSKRNWRAKAKLHFHRSPRSLRSEEHTSELQSLAYLVCRLLLEKKK